MTVTEAVPWHGYWPASPTPFTAAGALDVAALHSIMDLYVSHGVHGVLINGTTGEWWAQTTEERRLVVREAVAAIDGRVPVVVGITDFTPGRALDLAEAAASAGADGVLATVPPYVRPTERETVRWYEDLACRSPLPIMVYNWPRGVGVDIPVDILAELAAVENVAAIKDSSGDELKTIEGLERVAGRVRFFARFISRRGLAVLTEIGGDGNIDGGGIAALLGSAYYDAVWAGNLEAARHLAERYQMIAAALANPDYSGRFGSPVAQVKAVMRTLGQPGGHVRAPLLDVDDAEAQAAIGPALRTSGLAEGISAALTPPRQPPEAESR